MDYTFTLLGFFGLVPYFDSLMGTRCCGTAHGPGGKSNVKPKLES